MKNSLDITSSTATLDAKGQILGRFATKIADILRGKNKPTYVANLVMGEKVVVLNAKDIKVTGRKLLQKEYIHHTGWPGGFRKISLKDQMQKDPCEVIRKAVEGMLPKNRLQRLWMKNLRVYSGEEIETKKNKKSYGQKSKLDNKTNEAANQVESSKSEATNK